MKRSLFGWGWQRKGAKYCLSIKHAKNRHFLTLPGPQLRPGSSESKVKFFFHSIVMRQWRVKENNLGRVRHNARVRHSTVCHIRKHNKLDLFFFGKERIVVRAPGSQSSSRERVFHNFLPTNSQVIKSAIWTNWSPSHIPAKSPNSANAHAGKTLHYQPRLNLTPPWHTKMFLSQWRCITLMYFLDTNYCILHKNSQLGFSVDSGE